MTIFAPWSAAKPSDPVTKILRLFHEAGVTDPVLNELSDAVRVIVQTEIAEVRRIERERRSRS